MRPRVSCLGVFHDPVSATEVERAVPALVEASPGLDLEFLVCDNSAGRARVPGLTARAGVRVLDSGGNIGYGRAIDGAARLAAGDWLLVMNPDLRARPGAVARLIAEAEAHPEAAVFGPRLLNPDGSPQHSARRFYRWWTVCLRRTPLRRIAPFFAEHARHLLLDLDPEQAHEVDWVIGACMFFRRDDFLGLGGFDPGFFLYFEDVDLCLRAWQAGRTVRYVGEAAFVHGHRRQSASFRPNRLTLEHLRSMWLFRARHGGWAGRHSPARHRPVVFVNEGRGALAERAGRFAAALGGSVLAKDALAGRRLGRAARAVRELVRARPPHVHVLDVGMVGLAVECAARLLRARVVLDTGDEHMALARRTGRAGGPLLEVHGAVERAALALADVVVVRGRGHAEALAGRGLSGAVWIPDGVDPDRFAGVAAHPWRRERGWDDRLVVASVASLHLDRRYGSAPGAELLEALALLPAVRGAILGGGEGRALLEERARALGVADRVEFLGQADPRDLPRLLVSFDVCLSTQTDDAVGRARTTGKLPLFLAAGRYVLASDVGEAARILPREMLVPYHGERDPDYPRRLAERLAALDADRGRLAAAAGLPALARELFDYRRLAAAAAALAVPERGR